MDSMGRRVATEWKAQDQTQTRRFLGIQPDWTSQVRVYSPYQDYYEVVPPNAHEATYVRSYYGPPYGKCPWYASPSPSTILCQALPMIHQWRLSFTLWGYMYFPDLTLLNPRFKTESLGSPHSARQPSNDNLVLLATPGGYCGNDILPIPKV